MKGVVKNREGVWIRTYKTGNITEIVAFFKLKTYLEYFKKRIEV